MELFFWFRAFLFTVILIGPGCTEYPRQVVNTGDAKLIPTLLNDLPGWDNDSIQDTLIPFYRSCKKILLKNPSAPMGSRKYSGFAENWQLACRALPALDATGEEVRRYLNQEFKAYKIIDNKNLTGLFTGYFEPILKGSRNKTKNFTTPVYPRPKDLVLVSLGDWRQSLKGERIAGKLSGPRLKPYFSRTKIRKGALNKNTKPILWLESDIDAFFLHIQGSGRIDLSDGSTVRLGYAGHNGHNYFPIGRYLKEIGAIKEKDMSLQKIKNWLLQNPEKRNFVMDKNPSYIFFREVSGAGPVGAHGVALTPGRSLAVDRRFISLGTFVWLTANYSDENGQKLQRLMVAQDTGGAIKGMIRGDVFWGSGATALKLAGPMKAQGELFLIIPKSIEVVGVL